MTASKTKLYQPSSSYRFVTFAAAEIAICIWAIVLTVKAHRYLKQLQKESKIYE
jgi:tellurite resistance protein TehA-like permease